MGGFLVKMSNMLMVDGKVYRVANASEWLEQQTKRHIQKSGISTEHCKLMKRGGGVHQEQLACQGRYR